MNADGPDDQEFAIVIAILDPRFWAVGQKGRGSGKVNQNPCSVFKHLEPSNHYLRTLVWHFGRILVIVQRFKKPRTNRWPTSCRIPLE